MAGYREFQTGEVLTAANVNGFLMNQAVMVFATDAARTTALAGVLAEGMLTYNLDTKALEVYDGTAWGPVVTAKEKRIEAFTGSGTWTVPAGVTYAIAHMVGGGGGVGSITPRGGDGGTSSVAFSSGTVSALGGVGSGTYPFSFDDRVVAGGLANTGGGATQYMRSNSGNNAASVVAGSGGRVTAGAAVTPGASITVTVGAGGTAGTTGAAGGSGYVYIEYFEEV